MASKIYNSSPNYFREMVKIRIKGYVDLETLIGAAPPLLGEAMRCPDEL